MARLGVYTDYTYSLRDGQPHAERSFALFVAALAERFERTVLIGRLDPAGEARYPLGGVELCPLSNYPSLSHTLPALRGMLGSLRPFWRALEGLDLIWILGPHPLAFPFALLARLRGRAVVLGVRQDTVEYVRNRHPGSRRKQALAKLMDAGFRALGRRWPVVVVGPAIAEAYRSSPRLLEISVSLIARSQIAEAGQSRARDYSGELRALSVGRLETEKNPLALADVLADLRRRDERWRLVVCGEGELRPALESRLRELGVDAYAELPGYLGHDSALGDQYRRAHALVLVSWTEGLPQVLYEAFAAGLPVAATDVGGIAAAAGDAVLLVPPGDPEAMAASLARIGEDAALRERLVHRGLALVAERTIESETARVAEFLEDAERQPPPSTR
ncbi:MAG: glycosyltransferase [Actinobacteria bacterium]|nr:glycosyltransferase [Actinomycetota bacterium]